MSCPTCDHTMHGLGANWFWCPRCGTVLSQADRERTISIPHGVQAVRNWLFSFKSVTKAHARDVFKHEFLLQHEREHPDLQKEEPLTLPAMRLAEMAAAHFDAADDDEFIENFTKDILAILEKQA